MLNGIIRFFLENKLVAWILLLLCTGWGLIHAPFDFKLNWLPRDPVAVDAIPDIGENQQIVFTRWMGRSPQDVEDQITYPLTSALLGIPGVKTIRSNSMFGFSTIYIIFNEDVEFYWSRSRILEKLNSLPANLLPEGVQPALGPDATALGQIFWYTLEGRDSTGAPTGGWDPQELRSIQDFYVRYGLSAVEGVSEVASVGGFVREYQIDVDPDAMKINNISLEQVMAAVKGTNIDVGAQTMEINLAEYFVRGLGYIRERADIENAVVKVQDNVPLYIRDIANVSIGPATRRGALDKSGAEAVGGVVVARYGSNPMQVIENLKVKISELEPGLPSRVLEDGRVSQVRIVPFYDRTELIRETIGTLREALTLEVLITVIVVILMLFNLKSSLLVSGMLPVAVLICFVAMRQFGIDANIVSLSGIAIAIGTMVDMGIVLTESMVKNMREAPPGQPLMTTIYEATTEVASAVLTAVSTTIVSFLPVFAMEAAEGKLFRPLAYTKTFALLASIALAITVLPALAQLVFSIKAGKSRWRYGANLLLLAGGMLVASIFNVWFGLIISFVASLELAGVWIQEHYSPATVTRFEWGKNILYAGLVAVFLTRAWMPLGVSVSLLDNFLFVGGIIALLMLVFFTLIRFYEKILRFLLQVRWLFLATVTALVIWGISIFRNTGQEFMPALNEGSFLLMPTSMPHTGMQQNINYLRALDMAVTAIPEVESVVGKLGRVESALDPAPVSMFENIILYKSEYKVDENGYRLRFRTDADGNYVRDKNGVLVEDPNGKFYRQWRDHIRSPDDIWQEVVAATRLPGLTSAPKLQPIETRLVMLQTGMRAPMGIKVKGPDLATIEAFGLQLEKHLKAVEGVKAAAVFADRIVGKPYLELRIDREAIARHGLSIEQVQRYIQAGIGGMPMTNTVEGRERYPVRIRYPRELRSDPEIVKRILVPTRSGSQIPLGALVEIEYRQGPQSIKSEDSFLVGYVLFDREADQAEVTVVNRAQQHLEAKIRSGELVVPPGVSYRFAGSYEQQVRASKRLGLVLPIALCIIFLILYFEFRSVAVTAMVFAGVFIAFAGGFIMIWLYGQSWFLNLELFGVNMRDLFQMHPINLSVAVWVGFLALFGVATDDGVLVATFLRDSFRKNHPTTVAGIRQAVVEGGLRRVRPATMTAATTILALLPVLTSTGRGADVMVPMAIPSFGGMCLQLLTMFTVPVLYCMWKEGQLKWRQWFDQYNNTTHDTE
ncbi:MAG: efflux RND transporter permease subunit [Bacteroidetes bacterium]|nr:MAG: efflux RND transporter permease subunit [Bacteroidota bacterium]